MFWYIQQQYILSLLVKKMKYQSHVSVFEGYLQGLKKLCYHRCYFSMRIFFQTHLMASVSIWQKIPSLRNLQTQTKQENWYS